MDIKKFNQGSLFFSNKVEKLFDQLRQNLFKEEDVFADRILIFPSREMEKWVRLRLAKAAGIATGVRAFFLSKAIHVLSKEFFISEKSFFLPDEFELTLKIEEILSNALIQKDPHFEPLKRYLNGSEKRLMTLAKSLSFLFQRYGVYGGFLCKKWEEDPQNWQEHLWQRLFKVWDTPLKVLPQLKLREESNEASFHLFSFSHLSPLYFDFFQTLSSKHAIYFYQLSPCLEFWSDFPSKRAFTRFDEEYLLEINPLLAFTGRVGKEMAKLIEDAEGLFVYEDYEEPEGEEALQKLQKNLLLLKNETLRADGSIQIHSSKTELREIQNLYNFILSQIEKRGFLPQDFLVLAPDISVYEPYIRAIFAEPQIADIEALHKNKCVEGIFLLLDLDAKRWSSKALLHLFAHPLFRKKRGWSLEDIELLKNWVEKTGIRWGLDKEHRDTLLQASYCNEPMNEEKATWKMGIDLLLEKLAVAEEKPWIQFTEAELLGECAQTLEKLHHDLKELKNEKTLKSWADYFLKLLRTYFAESEDETFFIEKLERFNQASLLFPKRTYSFETLHFLLKEWVGKASLTLNSNILSSVFFCSIAPMRAIPAKVICILGMNEGSFPRKEASQSLDLLKKQKGGDFAPTKTDFDYYLFLEAILSARNVLMLSYLDNDTPPSTLITELLRSCFKTAVVQHPIKSHDPSYFDCLNQNLESYSSFDYELAKRFQTKKKIPSFFDQTTLFHKPQGEFIIDISELNRLVRSPLSLYFEKKYGVSFKEEKELKDEEAFTLSPLQKSALRKLALKEPTSQILEKAAGERDFPLGIFGKIAKEALHEEISEDQRNLKNLGPCYTLELVLQEKNGFFDDRGVFRTPALKLDLEGISVTITGKIDGVFQEGLISFNKSSFQNGAKLWPALLIASLVKLPPECDMKALYFVKEDEKKEVRFDAKKILFSFLQYSFYAAQSPSPLFLEWLEPFLKKDIPTLKKKASWQEIQDPILQWAVAGREAPDFSKLIETWHPFAEEFLREIYDVWF